MQGMKPLAIYKDEQGEAITYSALCPHMKGVIVWNAGAKNILSYFYFSTLSLPFKQRFNGHFEVHGSRFDGATGR